MTIKLGRVLSSNDSPILDTGTALNNTTAVAMLTTDPKHSTLIMTNDGNQDAWIRLKAASVDNTKHGFILYKGTTTTLDLSRVNYLGEISGIAKNGNTTVYTTVL